MATRTNRLIGKVWGDPSTPGTLVVHYNGVTVFSGTVPTTAGTFNPDLPVDQFDVLCSWDGDSSVEGTVPVSISEVQNGVVQLYNIKMNQLSEVVALVFKTGVTWPGYQPSSVEEMQNDKANLTDVEFVAKYNAPKSFYYDVVESTVTVSIQDNYTDPYGVTTDTDGKNNVLLDGIDVTRSTPLTTTGIWQYGIPTESTLTFNLLVTPRIAPPSEQTTP